MAVENQNSGPTQRNAPCDVLGPFRKGGGARRFGRALAVAYPGLTGRQLRAVFDNKVSRQAVLRWRDGARQAPPWAWKIVSDELQRQAQTYVDMLRECPDD